MEYDFRKMQARSFIALYKETKSKHYLKRALESHEELTIYISIEEGFYWKIQDEIDLSRVNKKNAA